MRAEGHPHTLSALFVDDDPEIVAQCKELLPHEIGDHNMDWTFCDTFEEAIGLLESRRFDVLVTDVYKGRKLSGKLDIGESNNFAKDLVRSVKKSGFSLIVLYSDGPQPEGLIGPSIRFVDKAAARPAFPAPISDVLADLVASRGKTIGIVDKIRKELERSAGSYIWDFIDQNWDELQRMSGFDDSGLERLIRRRAAIQINEKLEADGLARRSQADRYDYYICPPLPGPLRLGTLLQRVESGTYFVVLTPHCHLVQNGTDAGGKLNNPRAETVLLSECISAKNVLQNTKKPDKKGCLRIPAREGKPEGRYCFLPSFVAIPDLYCDLMKLSSVPYQEVASGAYRRVAIVDSPFAEAIQSSMARFYANVGHRNLEESDFSDLFPPPAAVAAASPQSPS